MSEARVLSARRSLTTPRAAAVAGIVFAVLYGASQLLIRISTPTDEVLSAAWLQAHSGTIALALNLVPYAGIAFLWFIGVIRDRIGAAEDRLFATVFLGSGLLFLALTFVGAALSGGLLASYAVESSVQDESVLTFGRAVIYNVINIYAIRMAGVFMMSLATISMRTGVMHRGLAILTYALALVLLVSISHSLWVTLIFPGWVLAVSVYFLIRIRGNQSLEEMGEAGTS